MAATVCRVGREALAVTRVSIWEAQADTAVLLAQSGGQPIPLGSRVAVDGLVRLPEAMESGRPVFVPDSLAVDSVVQRELAARIGVRSVVQAPVDLGGGGTLVAIVSWDRVVQPPAEVWLDVVVRFAQQAALAVEQSRRRRAQIEAGKLSAQLQASLLPTSTLESTVVEVAALYQPGERRMLLGGDFYDVAEHVEGCISVLIGDVTGHGPEAAAIGATLRAGWRTLVLTGAAPEEIMPALDELLRSERTTDEQLVSIACAQISEGRLTLASAGHPPPLLISEQGPPRSRSPMGSCWVCCSTGMGGVSPTSICRTAGPCSSTPTGCRRRACHRAPPTGWDSTASRSMSRLRVRSWPAASTARCGACSATSARRRASPSRTTSPSSSCGVCAPRSPRAQPGGSGMSLPGLSTPTGSSRSFSARSISTPTGPTSSVIQGR
jgi:hypothetical protein